MRRPPHTRPTPDPTPARGQDLRARARRLLGLTGAVGGLGLLATTGLHADAPTFSPTRITPGGSAGSQALLAGEALATFAPAVRQQVAAQGFYTGEALGTSDCATCHSEIAAQWAQSAHHFSSFNNPYYAASVDHLRTQRPHPAGRFCAGCHDPLLLVDDSISAAQLTRDIPAAQAGLPCLVCHSMVPVEDPAHGGPRSRMGNGAYDVVAAPVPPPAEGPATAAKSPHGARLRPASMSGAAFCAACHKVGLTPAITHAGWLRGQDDYGAWLASMAAGNGVGAVYRPETLQVRVCQDCHMPLEPLRSGRMVRSHRFLGGNSALPHLRDATDMAQREGDFLRGAVSLDIAILRPQAGGPDVPQFADRVPVPEGSRVQFDVILRNRRVGHRFPGGTNDSNDVWVEIALSAPDQPGAPILVDGSHLVRAQPVDGDGRPLLRRDPQNMRAGIYNTSVAPADPQVVRYAVDLASVPALQAALRRGALTLRATLRYRKFTPDYAQFACAALPAGPSRSRCLQPPTVDVAQATRTLLPAGSPHTSDDAPAAGPPLWERYLDHGLGLADGLVDTVSAARPSLDRAQALAPGRVEPVLGQAKLALALGLTDDVLRHGAAAEAIRATHPAHLWLRGQALYRTYQFDAARPYFERAALLLPGDPNVLAMLARARGLTGDAAGSLAAADRLLVIDPESEDGHHARMLALRELGRIPESEAAESRYLYYRRPVEIDQELRQQFRAREPRRAQEDVLAHTHTLTP